MRTHFRDLVDQMGPLLNENFEPAVDESKMAHAEDDDEVIVKTCLAASAKVAEAMKLEAAGDAKAAKAAIDDAIKLMNSIKSIELGNQNGPKHFERDPKVLLRMLTRAIGVHAKDAGLTVKPVWGLGNY